MPSYDCAAIARRIEQRRLGHILVYAGWVEWLASSAETERYDLSCLRDIMYGGSVMRPQSKLAAMQRAGVGIIHQCEPICAH